MKYLFAQQYSKKNKNKANFKDQKRQNYVYAYNWWLGGRGYWKLCNRTAETNIREFHLNIDWYLKEDVDEETDV